MFYASFYRYDIGGDCDCGWDERRELVRENTGSSGREILLEKDL